MSERTWGELHAELRERHRSDLLQVLAYANLAATPRVIVCLAYPCRPATWTSHKERGRLFHRAALVAGPRRVEILLTAVPMQADLEPVLDAIAQEMSAAE